MKPRIKMDSTLLAVAVVLTAVWYRFPALYLMDLGVDNILDFLGMIFLLKGIYLRMAARGYKKTHSQVGGRLVTGGPYSVVRNPMYLGTFLIGLGYVFLFWPWWTVPVFMGLFYARFIRQVRLEEKHLNALFGETYQRYCQEVPRFFPGLRAFGNLQAKETFPWELAWSTKEKRVLFILPPVAFVLEVLQEKFIFGSVDVLRVAAIFGLAILVYGAGLWFFYRIKK